MYSKVRLMGIINNIITNTHQIHVFYIGSQLTASYEAT